LADADFSKAIELDPAGAASYLVWRGDLRLKHEQAERAIEDFDRALAMDPINVYALSRRASAHWAARDLDKALADFARAMELDGEWVWVRNGRGLVYHDRADYEAALADFNESVQLDPDHAATYEYRAETLYKMGRRPEALADLNESIKRNPESPRLFNRRAMLHYFNKEYSKAVRDHTAALKCDPQSAQTFNYLAWVWSTAPDPTVRNGRRALECATRACELSEWQTPGFLDTLAAAHAEVGNFDEAERWAERAADLADSDKARREYLARAEQYVNAEPLRVTPADEEARG
jgi:tetratricopeptide (TPR) repeat protein